MNIAKTFPRGIQPHVHIPLKSWVSQNTEVHQGSIIWELGGTIACNPTEEGAKPGSIAHVLDDITKKLVKEVRTIAQIDSSQIDPDTWCRMLEVLDISGRYNKSALFFTCSHSPYGIQGSDAQINIRRAILLANANLLKPAVYVVVGNNVYLGNSIRKVHTTPKEGVYIIGKRLGSFDEEDNFWFDCDYDVFITYFNPFFSIKSKWICGDVITHGSDTIAYSSYVAELFYGFPNAEIAFGNAELLDVDNEAPLLLFENAIKRLKERAKTSNKRQGLLVSGLVTNPKTLNYLSEAAKENQFQIFLQSQPFSKLTEKYPYLGSIDERQPLYMAHIKLMMLLGQEQLRNTEIFSLMHQNIIGEILDRKDNNYDLMITPELISIPDNIRFIRATPGVDALAIKDAITELHDKVNPKLILGAFGDGNFPFSQKLKLLERFKDLLTPEALNLLNTFNGSTEALRHKITQAIKEEFKLTDREAAEKFLITLKKDTILEAILAAKEANIEIYVGTIIPKIFPNLQKYEPGSIMKDIVGAKTLTIMFDDLEKLNT